jgi:hypothetical protein
MPSISEIATFFKYLWPKRKPLFGLLCFYIFSVLLLIIIFPQLKEISKRTIVIIGIIVILETIIWLYNAGRLLLPSKKIIKIAIALKPDNHKSQLIIDKALQKIWDTLNSLNIDGYFKIYHIDNSLIRSAAKAEKYLKKKKLILVFAGNVYSGNCESKFRYDLNDCTCSYNLFDVTNSEWKKIIFNDLILMLANRKWIIEESNDIIDIKEVANNYVEVILSFVSIILSFKKQYLQISVQLLEVLLPQLSKRINPEIDKIVVNSAERKADIPVKILRTGRLKTILANCYLLISNKMLEDGHYDDAEKYALMALQYNANIVDCYSELALVKYYKGDILEARRYSNEIGKIDKHNIAYYFNMAFFSIIDKKYDDTTLLYTELRKYIKAGQEVYVKRIISFLTDRKNENPEEFAYDYAIAINTYNYIDKAKGKQLLSSFVRFTNGLAKYKCMIDICKMIH